MLRKIKIMTIVLVLFIVMLGCDEITTTTAVTISPTTTESVTTNSAIPSTTVTLTEAVTTISQTTEMTTTVAQPLTTVSSTTVVTTLPLTTIETTEATTVVTSTEPLESTAIGTALELVQFITSGNPAGNYHLIADIDLESIELTGSSIYYSGVFDGNGHTLSNAVINASGNKMGFLFKQLSKGGIIRNVNFTNCIHNGGGTSEASAFVSAFAQGGATFENLSFRNTSVVHTGSYAALLFGDVTADSLDPLDKIMIRNITLINDENNKIQGGDYMGGLVGAARKHVRIEMRNIYIDSVIRSTGAQTTGILMGRDNSANVELTVDNVVIKGELTSAKDTGVILGRSSAETVVNATNVFLGDLIVTSGNSAVNIGIGNQAAGSIKNSTNVYYDADTTVFNVGSNTVTVSDGTQMPNAQITSLWFDESGFDKQFFKYQNQSIIRNIEHSGPVVETGITVVTADIKANYLLGEPLDLANLRVYLNYSDDTTVLLDQSAYTINDSAFDNSLTGSYAIAVNYGLWSKQFTVTVIEVTGLIVDSLLIKEMYLVGSPLDLTGIVVKAMLSDGGYFRLEPGEYELDSSAFIAETPGSYDLCFSYNDFPEVVVKVHVVPDDPLVIDNKLNIVVDHEYTGVIGALVGDSYRFKTIKQAFQHLYNLQLDGSVEKIIRVEEGTYYEKVTLQVPRVRLIGAGRETTIITYDAASGLESPGGANWGTQGSATVAIKSQAADFIAANISFENSFDYLNSLIGDKQAVALVNEADKAVYYNCGFLGYQDTLYAKSGRQYYQNVYVEGVVDFIFGNGGPAFFEDSVIKMLARPTSGGCLSTNKGYATSESALLDYGFVFFHNELIADPAVSANSIYLGRPWGANAAIAYIENTFGEHISSIGWTDMSGNLPENARFYEYGNISEPDIVLATTTKGKALTEQEALVFTNKEIVFARVNGDHDFGSDWDYAVSLGRIADLLTEE